MTLEEAQQIVRDALAPLCTPLHEGIAEAAEDANLFFGEHGMMDKIYNPGRHHLARCLAHRRLSRRARRDLGGWKVATRFLHLGGIAPESPITAIIAMV